MMTREYFRIFPTEVLGILKLFSARLLSNFIKDKDLWLISERGHEARDNAYFLFMWLRYNHPEINAKYVISKQSADLHKLVEFKANIIYYNSFRHFLSIFQSKYLISTHICGYRPNVAIFSELDRYFDFLKKKKIVFLQHGIIKNNLTMLYANNVHVDLFICGAKPEYDYVKAKFGYKEGVVRYTGLCRYDNLNSFKKKPQILIMPTWRKYIDESKFDISDYFMSFKSLLLNSSLHRIVAQNGFQIIFYPHYEVQKFISLFSALDLPDFVTIADFEYDVQTLLKESSLLITDYSSVFFDFAYMQKPIIFYQFDRAEFCSKHYENGYFDESSFGQVVFTERQLLQCLLNYFNNGMSVEKKYMDNIDSFFCWRDSNNCLRVFNAVNSL